VFSAIPETLSERVRDLVTTGEVKALDRTAVTVQASMVCVYCTMTSYLPQVRDRSHAPRLTPGKNLSGLRQDDCLRRPGRSSPCSLCESFSELTS
jgi:hypothetical protein